MKPLLSLRLVSGTCLLRCVHDHSLLLSQACIQVEVERIVIKEVEVPVERIVVREVEVPVEKIVVKEVPVVVEKVCALPSAIENRRTFCFEFPVSLQ